MPLLESPGAVDTTLVLPVVTFEPDGELDAAPPEVELFALPGCTTGVGAPEITTGLLFVDEAELDLLAELELDDLLVELDEELELFVPEPDDDPEPVDELELELLELDELDSSGSNIGTKIISE